MITLAERTGALLATSICGHGLFAGNPWSVGISGGFASPAADGLIAESDLILGFGVSLTHWTTKRGKLIAPGAVVAQIDIEAGKLGYQMPVQHAVQADARIAAQAILAELDRARNRLPRGSPHCRHAQANRGRRQPQRTLSGHVDRPLHRSAHAEQGRRCDPAEGPCRGFGLRPFLRLGAALPARAERQGLMPQPFLPVRRSRARIGHRPGHRESGPLAVLGAGDGGFLMSIADLETAVRLELRMCLLIYNDSSYAAEVHLYRRRGYSVDIVQFPDTDFAAIARGHGARGATVRSLGDLEPVRAWVREARPACS